jgi:hypothetical protein
MNQTAAESKKPFTCSVAYIDLYGDWKNNAGIGLLAGKAEGRDKIKKMLIQCGLSGPS